MVKTGDRGKKRLQRERPTRKTLATIQTSHAMGWFDGNKEECPDSRNRKRKMGKAW